MSVKTGFFSVMLMVCAAPAFASGTESPAASGCEISLDQQRQAEAERLKHIKPSAMPPDFFPGQASAPNWGEAEDPYGYGSPIGFGEFPGR